MSRSYRLVKRGLDVAVAMPTLVLAGPVLVVVAWLVRRDGGPALYRGLRVGRDGQPFMMYKIRTMVVDGERKGGSSTSNHDPRLTSIGRVLRRWKLDEVPQLINVLKGEMSLVGPRPQVAHTVETYTEQERRLLTVLPGITDWASVRFRDEGALLEGFADPDRAYEELIRPEKSRLGLLYVDTASFRTDIAILVQTVRVLLGQTPQIPVPERRADPARRQSEP